MCCIKFYYHIIAYFPNFKVSSEQPVKFLLLIYSHLLKNRQKAAG